MLPLSSPTKLGRYEVVDEIGKGAMGVVYLARDPLIGRLVALKTFRIGLSVKDAELDQFRARFIREAQSAGILSHPNIVTIHDVVERSDDGVAFIAMEYVRGTNLKLVLQQPQRPTLPYAAEILGQIASGLDYAHSCKVIHRDIKPANILITSDNRAKITDFGIARLDTSNLTQEGQLLGTPNYMSPEQILGRDVDARADIFSLGVVLYEMITRHKPFQGENLTMVSHRIVYDQFTPPSEYVDDLPPGTEQILGKALEKDPARRYQRAQDMAEDLRKVIGSVATRDHLNETQSLSSTAFIPVPAPAPRAAGGPGGRRPGAATDPIPVIPLPPAAPTAPAPAAPAMPPPPMAAAAAAPPAIPASSPAPAPGQAGTGSFWRRLTERGRGAGGRGAAVAAAGSQPAPAAPPAAASGPGSAPGVEPATTRLDAATLAAAGAAALVAGAAGATTPAAGAAGRTAAAVPAPSPPAAAADRPTAQPDRPSQPTQPTQPTQVNAAATVSPGRAGSSEMPTAPLPIRPAGGQVSGPAAPPPTAGAAASASPAGDGYRHGTRPIPEPVPPVGGRFDAGSPSAGAAQQMRAGGEPGTAPGGLAPVTPSATPTLTAPLGSPASATPPPPPPPVRAPSSYPPSTAVGGAPQDSPAPQAAATAPVAPTAQMAPIAPAAARPKRGFFSLPSALGFILALAIGLVLAGALVAAQVVWTQTQRVPAQQARKLAAEQETRQRVMSLLADGHHRLEVGDSDGAVAAFRAAEQLVAGHRGPVSLRTAAEHLQSDQRLRVDQERQIETRLIEGRQFLADRRYDEAEAAAQAALTISPGNTVALDILNGVKAARTRTRDRAAAQAALAARAAIPAPPPVAPAAPPHAEPAPATAPAEAKDASLDISFFSQLPEGSLLIYVNGSKLLQESWRFYEKGGLFRSKPTSGTLRRSFKLKAGNAEIRLYVTPQGSAAVVKILSGNFPGGGARRLDIRLDGDGNVSYQLN